MTGGEFRAAMRTPASDVLEEFMSLNGRYSNFTKETFFLRYASRQNFDRDMAKLRIWAEKSREQREGYVFEPLLRSQLPAGQVDRYVELYHNGTIRYPFRFRNPIWQKALEDGLAKILDLFKRARGRNEESIIRNFAVKILYWMDTYFPQLFLETEKMNRFPKFACSGSVKLAEYLFLYLLFLLGCDVLYISQTGDVFAGHPELLELSLFREGKPDRQPEPAASSPSDRVVISMNSIRRPERHIEQVSPAPRRSTPVVHEAPVNSQSNVRQPMEYVEIAKCASSVVMIKVFDQNNQCFKSGSGVIISDKGYVLTNLHVVSGGHHYGILLEEENDIFYTNELIKYHQDFDLAVLRMEKRRRPIPISRNPNGLVRGQKVVAIGSPLGLFNSVSDGIIAGFRELEKVSMIQFTAPVSHGSSGGALLDLYGDLIGLITGGYDEGQNLNLAVGYQTIYPFVSGLL